MDLSNSIRFVLIACFLLVVAGCTTVTVPCKFPAPPKMDLPGVKTIHVFERVLDSSEDAGNERQAHYIADDLSIAIQQWKGFICVERDDLGLILKKMEVEITDLFEDPEVARRVGGMLGADALVLCDVKKYDGDDSIITKERPWLDYWKPFIFWSDLTPKMIHTRTCTVEVAMVIKVLELETAVRHDAHRLFTGKETAETSLPNENPAPIPRDDLYRKVCKRLVDEFAATMFPYMEAEPVAFQRGGMWFGLYNSPKMDNGIIFVKKRHFREALEEFTLARDAAKSSDEEDRLEEEWKALMNMGITQACLGNFMEAENNLLEAKGLLPDFRTSYYADSLGWIRERQKRKKKFDDLSFPGKKAWLESQPDPSLGIPGKDASGSVNSS